MRIPKRMVVECLVLGMCAAVVMGQQTIRPTRPEMQSFFATTKEKLDAKLSTWRFYHIMHSDREKLKAEWTVSPPTEPTRIYQCGPTASDQQDSAKAYAGYVDVFDYSAFVYTSNDKPDEKELIWPGYDNSFINHARQMRHLCGTTPVVATLRATVGSDQQQRPITLEEVQWQFIAAVGCGYRGVVWPVSYDDVTWGDELRQIEERIGKYGRSLAQAKSVNWAAAPKNQPASVLASEEHLFVFLLNEAYMTFDINGKTVVAPLEKHCCEGVVALNMPAGLKVRRGQALSGKALRLSSQDGKITVEYSFTTGGEMLIFALGGKAEPPVPVKDIVTPVVTQPNAKEVKP